MLNTFGNKLTKVEEQITKKINRRELEEFESTFQTIL